MKLKTPEEIAALSALGMHTNYIGLPHHPTDDLVHWTESEPNKAMLSVRNAYDKIVEAGLLDEVSLLLEAAITTAKLEEAEQNAGPSI